METINAVLLWIKINFSNILSLVGVLFFFVFIYKAKRARDFANKAKTIVERDEIFKAIENVKFIINANTELFRFINPNLNTGKNTKKLIVDKATAIKKTFIEMQSIIPAESSDSSLFAGISSQDINSIYTEIISSSEIYDEQIKQLDNYFLELQEYLKIEKDKFMNAIIDLRKKKLKNRLS